MIFEVNGLKLVGNYQIGDKHKPHIFIVHGGGLQPKQSDRFLEWQNILVNNGMGSFAFNHSGILPSEGDVRNTTLELRLLEARTALEYFLNLDRMESSNLVIVGVSMGGHIAAQLAAEIQPQGLILCEPGSFVEEAEDKPFGPIFTEALHKQKDWATVSTRSFRSTANYNGNLLIVVPENDLVVPKAVPERYFIEANSARTKELHILKNASHFYFRLNDPRVNPAWRKNFYEKTLSWLKNYC